jgi:ELWxxDGT repeat protein
VGLSDIWTGGSSSFPRFLTAAGELVFFTANDGSSGDELWKTDGVTSARVADINPGSSSSYARWLTAVGDTIFFSASDGISGYELWKSDGTSLGTTRVADINPGRSSSYPTYKIALGNTLFFTANDGSSGNELWKTDGVTTTRVADINPGPGDSVGEFNPWLTVVDGTVYFSANDGSSGMELWKTDGITTERVADIALGDEWSIPRFLTVAGTTLYFSANDGNNGSGTELWALDLLAPISINKTTAAITDVTDNVGLIKGSVAAGRRTDDRTPTIRGTIDAALASGETLRIFNGSTLLGSASVNNTAKTWSYTPTLPATAGTTYRITARVADADGNLGTASTARSFVLDTVAPATTAAITDVTDNVGLIKGSVAAGRRTDDRTPTIRGTIDAALASGETLRIFNGSTLLGSARVNNTAKTWSYTPTLPATAGTTYRITARVADAAGNLGTASTARSFVLDTVAPATTAAITDVTDNVGLIKGSVASGRRTDDRTPTIRGTIDAALARGETLRIFNGSTLLGSASLASGETFSNTAAPG